MAYEIELLIGNEKKKFVRNEPPMLGDMTKALIVQNHQAKMEESGPTEKDLEKNQDNLASFAEKFWHYQFKAKEFIEGCDLENMDNFNKALADALGAGGDNKEAKK